MHKELHEKMKNLLMILITMKLNFPQIKKILVKLKQKRTFATFATFGYENKLTFPIYISDQKFENSMDLLLIINENKSHYAYIKGFDTFMFHKTKTTFAKVVYIALVVKMY